jgi:hypothetical protein
MASNQNLQRQSEAELTRTFDQTVAVIAKQIGPKAFRPVRAVNAAVIDSLMTGLARRLATGPIKRIEQVREHYEQLLKTQVYWDAVQTGTSQEANVAARIDQATKEFALVK